MRRGRGVTVLGGASTRTALAQTAARLVSDARGMGLDRREVLALVDEQL